MKNLFLIDGASGIVKADIIEHVQNDIPPNVTATFVKKYTTRKRRPWEKKWKLDLVHVNKRRFSGYSTRKNFYSYIHRDEMYGFSRDAINLALDNHDNVFILVRNKHAINRLFQDYPHIRVVKVFVYADKEKVIRRLKRDKFDQDCIDNCVEGLELVCNDYFDDPDLYEEIITYESDRSLFRRVTNRALRRYITKPRALLEMSPTVSYQLIRSLVGFRGKIQEKIDDTSYQKNVFLMMRYRKENYGIYKDIKAILKKEGYNCIRADDQDWDITGDVYNPIAVLFCCKYGIALFDIPEKGNDFSPNVVYELGMMHLQNKKCLILKYNKLPVLPFSLVSRIHNVYKDNKHIQRIIRKWIRGIK